MFIFPDEMRGLIEAFNLLHSNGLPIPESLKDLEVAIPQYLETIG